ncbi:hypothetical protein Sjap_010025 [Stephania japonica]|uniref:Homeobox domain-containing protein n=1 Tax=Stephania japonica TaxID=461633 RepID=A0AAP0J8T9_9MAGN
MDHHPHQRNSSPLQPHQEDSGSSTKSSSFLCRQSSSRWTPTSDQIRILKDLYYNNGVRSPSAEQIQKIAARLRQYGKIEGKNVFYWFQNHKARERQKKRLTVDLAMQRSGTGATVGLTKYTNIVNPGISSPTSPSSPGVLGVGHIGSNVGYGSVLMEKSFRDCSISNGGSSSNMGGHLSSNVDWFSTRGGASAANDPYYSYSSQAVLKPVNQIQREEGEEEEEEEARQIETLPLFPMHGEENIFQHGLCTTTINNHPSLNHHQFSYNPMFTWYGHREDSTDHLRRRHKNGSRASLELSLNSYAPETD